jgi:hypothetical protein
MSNEIREPAPNGPRGTGLLTASRTPRRPLGSRQGWRPLAAGAERGGRLARGRRVPASVLRADVDKPVRRSVKVWPVRAGEIARPSPLEP